MLSVLQCENLALNTFNLNFFAYHVSSYPKMIVVQQISDIPEA